MAIVTPEEIAPAIDVAALAVAEKISEYVRKQRDNFNGKKITVNVTGSIKSEVARRVRKIFEKNGWSEVDFKFHQDPDPGDPRSSDYTDITLYARQSV